MSHRDRSHSHQIFQTEEQTNKRHESDGQFNTRINANDLLGANEYWNAKPPERGPGLHEFAWGSCNFAISAPIRRTPPFRRAVANGARSPIIATFQNYLQITSLSCQPEPRPELFQTCSPEINPAKQFFPPFLPRHTRTCVASLTWKLDGVVVLLRSERKSVSRRRSS